MTGTASVPAKVVQLIIDAGDRCAVNDLGVRGRGGVDIHHRQIIRCLDACAAIEGHGIQYFFAFGFHRLLRRSVAWSTDSMAFVLPLMFMCHTDLLFLSCSCAIRCDRSLRLARLRANNRLVPLPPLVCLKSAVFSSWKTSKFCASHGEEEGGTYAETPRF